MRQVLRFALAAVLTVCLLLCFAASADPLIPPENESELAEWLDSYPIDEMRALDTSAFLTFATDATDDSPATAAIVTGTVGEPSFIAVPATHDGVPVKAIASGAFAGNESLRLAVIPSSVTAMGTGLFAGCPNLHTLSLPFVGGNAGDANGLAYFNVPSDGALLQVYLTDETAIAPSAFAGYTSLRKVVLPASGLVSIGTRAFGGCTGLKEIVVPDAESIAEGAFTGCAGLVSMTLPFVGGARGIDGDPSAVFGTIFGGNRYDGGTPVTQYYNSNNARGTFIPANLTKVTITDESVIPYGAFDGMAQLVSLTYPDTVTSFGGRAFRNCSGLSDLPIPAGVTDIPYECFAGCTGLPADYVIPDGVKSIAQFAYRDCTSIEKLTVPDSVESIAEGAFSGCSGITDITLPFVGGARGIDGDPSAVFGTIFGGNRYDGGTPVTQNYNNSNARGTFIPANLTKVTITDESVIPYGAFDGMAQLVSLTYPDTVTSFGGRAFRNCSGLSDLPIPAGVTDIPYECFAGCTGLPADYVIPDGVKTVAQFAYRDCTGIEKLTLPDSVETIAEGAFSGCSGITDITLPFVGRERGNAGSREALFGYIFGALSYDGCVPVTAHYWGGTTQGYCLPEALRSVTVTDESILARGAFENMTMLDTVVLVNTVGSDLQQINANAFTGCSAEVVDLPAVNFLTDDGETAQTIEGVNGVGKVDVTVWLAADLAERPTVITAFFDGDGRLLGADTQVVSAENDVWKFTAALPDGVTVACVKVITLDGNLAPLARPAVLR